MFYLKKIIERVVIIELLYTIYRDCKKIVKYMNQIRL